LHEPEGYIDGISVDGLLLDFIFPQEPGRGGWAFDAPAPDPLKNFRSDTYDSD
jgi:hypothetical protein